MNNFLLKKINIGFGSKCQTWQEIYRPGSKRANLSIQFTLRKKREKLNVNVSSQTAYIYTAEEICCKKHIAYFFLDIVVNNMSKDYPNDECSPIYIAQFIGCTVEISQW